MATNIKSLIEPGVLMSLGARNFDIGSEAMTFDASILPFLRTGFRGERARKMKVIVVATDEGFSVSVSYLTRDRVVEHYRADRIGASMLNRRLLALDYDGDTVLNPRL